jgi:hypothetical protein
VSEHTRISVYGARFHLCSHRLNYSAPCGGFHGSAWALRAGTWPGVLVLYLEIAVGLWFTIRGRDALLILVVPGRRQPGVSEALR